VAFSRKRNTVALLTMLPEAKGMAFWLDRNFFAVVFAKYQLAI